MLTQRAVDLLTPATLCGTGRAALKQGAHLLAAHHVLSSVLCELLNLCATVCRSHHVDGVEERHLMGPPNAV
jgi:hypothetical protein